MRVALGFSVRHERADGLLRQLRQSRMDHSREALMTELCMIELLIVDDFALEPMTREQSRDVYQRFVERNAPASTIVMSNRDTPEWLAVFDDTLLGQSAVGRFKKERVRPRHRWRVVSRTLEAANRGGGTSACGSVEKAADRATAKPDDLNLKDVGVLRTPPRDSTSRLRLWHQERRSSGLRVAPSPGEGWTHWGWRVDNDSLPTTRTSRGLHPVLSSRLQGPQPRRRDRSYCIGRRSAIE